MSNCLIYCTRSSVRRDEIRRGNVISATKNKIQLSQCSRCKTSFLIKYPPTAAAIELAGFSSRNEMKLTMLRDKTRWKSARGLHLREDKYKNLSTLPGRVIAATNFVSRGGQQTFRCAHKKGTPGRPTNGVTVGNEPSGSPWAIHCKPEVVSW
ncbi:hypothetical protein CEXT_343471 [Caerostris extrusa]|uniref:Uncharacterized protein n=1 Tax=Caerostris extrusa TaxID=172846 RepID=A0AAV4QYM7_CAEEX|nr:hypothetical protein CEXT_343471 [Caerostris extrusa]